MLDRCKYKDFIVNAEYVLKLMYMVDFCPKNFVGTVRWLGYNSMCLDETGSNPIIINNY